MTTPETHPDLESLSAFVDGRLAGAERTRMIEHLARCDDCFEVVAETGEVQEELEEELEEEKTSLPGGAFDPEPRTVPDNVVLHPSAWKRWAPAASALAAALVLAVFGAWQMGWLLGPDLSVDTLASRLEGSAERLDAEAWGAQGWPKYRGEGSSVEEKRASFRAGVHAVDLQVALRVENRERATTAAKDLVDTLRDLPSVGPLPGSYQQLVDWLDSDRSLPEIAERAAAVDDQLTGLTNDLYYELGKWAEAGRLAALTGNREALRSSSLRGALEDFREAGLDEDVTARLDDIHERLRGDLDDEELLQLVRDFREIVGGDGVRLHWEPPAPSMDEEAPPTEPAEE